MKQIHVVVTAVLVAVFAVGCSKSKDDKAKAPPPAGKAEPAKPQVKAPPPKPAVPDIGAIMAPYAAAHDALIADKTDGVAAAAGKLAAAATKAGNAAADAVKPHYADLAKAAGELGKTAELDPARLAYGEVSKHLVMIMQMSPELAKGYHVFECPMAKGYNRWVQSAAELTNPYTGAKMLDCGAEVAFNDAAAKHDMKDMKGGDMKGMKHDMKDMKKKGM